LLAGDLLWPLDAKGVEGKKRRGRKIYCGRGVAGGGRAQWAFVGILSEGAITGAAMPIYAKGRAVSASVLLSGDGENRSILPLAVQSSCTENGRE
jgi:hypothetical protein